MQKLQQTGRWLGALAALVLACASLADASATLLLEEPYGKLGFFTATGHAAVYLSNVCAETPLRLRPCNEGETGIVISRYDRVGGYDWVAIPLIPYLYAVDEPDEVPLFADARMVSFLRDQYRRRYLEAIAPDGEGGATPPGNWYELVGSSYDRTIYAFEVETTAEQDAAFIEKYNAQRNESHFWTVSRNCADFAKDVINSYYPKALHRSVVADVGITTPKQMAKTFVKFSTRHRELQFSRFVIPQVPGTAPRSSAVHGVVESFFKSKKYIVPSAVASPIFAGCVVAVYVGTGAGHFDPGRGALMFDLRRNLEPPLAAEDRRSYQIELKHLQAETSTVHPVHLEKAWEREGGATPQFDEQGQPMLEIRMGERLVEVGMTADNILSGSPELAREILMARLQEELRRGGPPKASESDIARDWKLLQQAIQGSRERVVAESSTHASSDAPGAHIELTRGDRP